jgi:hypothetical protein
MNQSDVMIGKSVDLISLTEISQLNEESKNERNDFDKDKDRLKVKKIEFSLSDPGFFITFEG